MHIVGAAVVCIAVGFILFRMSILQSVALEQELRCEMKVHSHVDACYEGDFLVCEEIEHLHDANCYIVLFPGENVIYTRARI